MSPDPAVRAADGKHEFRHAATLAVVVVSALLATACARGAGGLTDRELAAARAWEPTRQGSRSALVILDMQLANMPIVDQAEVIANIRRLVERADAAGSPVVWVLDNDEGSRPGEPGFELIPDLRPAPGHISVTKTGTTAFSGTGLEATLAALGVGRLVFAGVYSDECVRRSVEAAFYDGWRTAVANDAHSVPVEAGRPDAIRSMNARWAADRRVELASTSKIQF